MKIILFILYSVFSLKEVQSVSKIHVDPLTGHFMDEAGRVRMFRGINSVNKDTPPYYYDILLNKTVVKELTDMGMNIIRLGNMWNGWQPTGPDTFNETYGDKLEEIVKMLEDNDIYTLLDVHQDGLYKHEKFEDNEDIVYNSPERGYWGVPPWIKQKLDGNARKFPWPFKNKFKEWVCRYFTEEISNAFGRLYQNYNGTADDFARFWGHVARRFKKYKSVIGYELLNEPWTANIFETGGLFNVLPGIAGSKFLKPFYDRLQVAIRKEDDNSIIFWEPMTWGYFIKLSPGLNDFVEDAMGLVLKMHGTEKINEALSELCGELQNTAGFTIKKMMPKNQPKLQKQAAKSLKRYPNSTFVSGKSMSSLGTIGLGNDSSVLGPGITESPGGPLYANRSAMSWHYYCWALGVSGSQAPYDPMKKAFCDNLFGPMVFNTAVSQARKIGGGQMMTEWGLCSPNKENPKGQDTIECNFVLEEAEKHFVSWIYWDTSSKTLGPILDKKNAIFFARPYPIATAGVPIKLSFDVWIRTFKYEFKAAEHENPETAKNFPTEIFVPKLQYPNKQYVIETSKDISWRPSPTNEDILQLFVVPSHLSKVNPSIHSFISIRPK